MSAPRQVHFARLPVSLPCPVSVVSGTPDTCDEHGEPIPLEQRTETCNVDAFWAIGKQVTCDVHLREACRFLDIDFDGVVDEAGGAFDCEQKPWAERHRYEQAAS